MRVKKWTCLKQDISPEQSKQIKNQSSKHNWVRKENIAQKVGYTWTGCMQGLRNTEVQELTKEAWGLAPLNIFYFPDLNVYFR